MAEILVRGRIEPQTKFWHLNARSPIQYAALFAVAFVVITPLVFIVVNSFHVQEQRIGGDTYWSLDGWRAAFSQPGMRKALYNTATLTIARQVIGLSIAILFVWLISRTDIPGKKFLEFGFWIAWIIPTLPVLLGWILLLHPSFGIINTQMEKLPLIGGPVMNIYSWWGIVWIHLVTGTIALKVVLLAPAFRNMDSSLEEAARISGLSTFGTLRKVVVPLMLPSIIVVTLMSVVASFQAFEVELVLGTPAGIDVFSTTVYRFIKQEPSLPGQAAALSIVTMAFMIPIILLQQSFVRRRRYTTVTGQYKVNVTRLGVWRWPAFALILGFLLMVTVLPMTFLMIGSFMKLFGWFEVPEPYTVGNWETVTSSNSFLPSLRNSLVLGAGTALLAMAWFSLVAYIVVRTQFRFRTALDFLSWLPWAVPGILMSLGVMWTVLQIPVLRPLFGTSLLMIIALSLGIITVAVQSFKATLIQIGNDLEEAARICGGSWLYTFRRVLMPLLGPTMVVVGLFAFVSAVRNVATIALLSSGGSRPLSLLQLDYILTNRLEAATVVGVITMFIIIAVALAAYAIGLRTGARAGTGT